MLREFASKIYLILQAILQYKSLSFQKASKPKKKATLRAVSFYTAILLHSIVFQVATPKSRQPTLCPAYVTQIGGENESKAK